MRRKKTLCFILMMIAILVMSLNAQAAVRITKKKASITVGKTVQLKVKGSKEKVKWITSNKKIATVTQKGRVKGKKPGKVTITAKVAGKKLKCIVTVKPIYVNKIRIKPGLKILMYVGDKTTIKATAYPRNATNRRLKFSTEYDEIISVNQHGVITAKSAGEACVWVEARDAEEVGEEIDVVVKEKTVTVKKQEPKQVEDNTTDLITMAALGWIAVQEKGDYRSDFNYMTRNMRNDISVSKLKNVYLDTEGNIQLIYGDLDYYSTVSQSGKTQYIQCFYSGLPNNKPLTIIRWVVSSKDQFVIDKELPVIDILMRVMELKEENKYIIN